MFFLQKDSPTETWNSPRKLSWLPGDHQGLSHLHLPGPTTLRFFVIVATATVVFVLFLHPFQGQTQIIYQPTPLPTPLTTFKSKLQDTAEWESFIQHVYIRP